MREALRGPGSIREEKNSVNILSVHWSVREIKVVQVTEMEGGVWWIGHWKYRCLGEAVLQCRMMHFMSRFANGQICCTGFYVLLFLFQTCSPSLTVSQRSGAR